MRANPTALIAQNDLTGLIKFLEKTTDLECIDNDRRTLLMEAVILQNVEAVRLIIEAGCNLDAQDRFGYTALHFAAEGQLHKIVQELLHAGAQSDLEDQNGNTPLSNAVFTSRGRGEAILALLHSGANPDKMNKSGISPRILADTIDNFDVKQFFNAVQMQGN